MEQQFHMGIQTVRRLKKKQKRTFFPSAKILQNWRILPSSKCENFVFFIDMLKGHTYLTKVGDLEAVDFFFPHLSEEEQKEKKRQLLKFLLWNQTLRWIFKKFLNRWRLKHVRRMNDTDPITLSPFENPVDVYYIERKIQYTFEASSILRDFHKKLTHNDGQIPAPISLKNPLTNEIFSTRQLLSIFHQCKQKGFSTWATESFRSGNFSMDIFLVLNRKQLRILAVDAVLKDINVWHGFDMLFDFIRTQHLDHKKPFDKPLYVWAMRNIESIPVMKDWKRECREWYISAILEDDPLRLVSIQEKIYRNTLELCDTYSFLVEEKKRFSKA